MNKLLRKLIALSALAPAILLIGCSQDQSATEAPSWAGVNTRMLTEANIAPRTRADVIPTGIESNLGEGLVSNIDDLPVLELAPGVTAKAYWGTGTLVSFITLDPNATIPASSIDGERFLYVMDGELQELVDGELKTMVGTTRVAPNGVSAPMPKRDFVYLEEGAETNITAGPQGAKALAVYSPIPKEYLDLVGAGDSYVNVDIQKYPQAPNVEPNRIYNLYDFQYTELVPGANARLVNGRGTQMSFLRMDPDIGFALHNHEEQMMIGLRGWIDEVVLDQTIRMFKGDMVFLPVTMIHGGTLGPSGMDTLDVFYPPRADYIASMDRRLAAYHAIISEGEEVQVLADGATSKPGLTFTEGPAWVNGKLYFSNMYFDADFNGDPSRSSLVEMDPNGSYRYISQGMQTNGIIPAANGNLIVDDMFGHRVIEMTTSGNIVRTLADSYDGSPVDGPNDLVMDTKGGIYFTDPQFTPDAVKNQPGRTVYYRNPQGEVIRVLPYDDFAMPNGVILSPDGKTLYVNNTYDHETWWNVASDKMNFVWAYDVNEDGSISNGRAFAELKLTSDVLDRGAKTSGADGMAIDTDGNLYVASYAGLQIFDANGVFVGMVNTDTVPVSVTFGGANNDTLYITSYDKIYSIKTNKTGYQLPN
jgi:gluconolactonase